MKRNLEEKIAKLQRDKTYLHPKSTCPENCKILEHSLNSCLHIVENVEISIDVIISIFEPLNPFIFINSNPL